ncbi:MAG: RNA polymerase subunit sigma-70 [Deltaproteobacteria bacterium]|mgnify:CR=1 FL=1|nr:MAG: RNA polymerase subunit sigma-70 [Deltaproteobacteria bacterium]RLB02300.1 MAG: RNA polymerase subunit sigma-70 [Deltaproteobacteria bacterium]
MELEERKEGQELPPLPRETAEEGIVPYDPLQRYLQEIRKIPLLTEEEERELAIRYKKYGDKEAAFKLIVSNLRLVVKIALEYHRYWTTNLLDLIQEGNVGLMQALKRFDPFRGVRFTSYASFWIRAYILKYIMENWRLVKIGTTQAQRKLFFDLKKEKERLEQMGFDPTPQLVAKSLNVKEEEVISMTQRLEESEISLDTQIGEDSRETLGDMIPAGGALVEEQVGSEEARRLLMEKIDEFKERLKARERDILEGRMLAEKPMTLRELGKKYGISPERVRQIEGEILKELREFLRREIPDFDEYRGALELTG